MRSFECPFDDELELPSQWPLDNVPLTIEAALDVAVAEGRMTIKEAEEAAEAYHHTFDANI